MRQTISKNNILAIWRIWFTFMIMAFHMCNAYGFKTGWYIGVEFFFVTSGALLANSVNSGKYSNIIEYLKHRLVRLYPQYLLALLLITILSASAYLCFHYDIIEIKRRLSSFFIELFLLQGVGLGLETMINVSTWYLSVMFLGEWIIFYFLNKHRKLFYELVAPLVILIVFSCMYRRVGCLQYEFLGQISNDGIYINFPFMRGLMEICFGTILFEVLRLIEIKQFRISVGLTFSIILVIIITLSSFYCYKTKYDFILLILIVAVVGISLNTPVPKLPKFIIGLDKLTYSLFLNHEIFRSIFPKVFTNLNVTVWIIYYVVVIAFSFLSMYVVEKILAIMKRKLIYCDKHS